MPTIVFSVLILFIDFIYFAHSTIIDRIGFNATLNQALLSSSEIIGVIFSLLFAVIAPRRFSGIVLYFICLVLSIIGMVVKVPADCADCFEVFIQMGLVMIARVIVVF